jgi:hypothetical protein
MNDYSRRCETAAAGRIYPLPGQEFAYPAEGGAEFVDGAAADDGGRMPGCGRFRCG